MIDRPSMLVTLVYERDTKHKTVYLETSPGGILNTLYLNTVSLRTVFGNVPRNLTIKIEEG